ncbi:cobyrinate a,c-diamide synthase [Clostridium grantii]|uniref:Cobyrinate a,c-diamide synthase n=1 Tax=Clostridium grantii DSM 8605 TaxID=1121316 RepID=A0A1M5V5B7_9CLOT|nr:cobyrinate a,c-diamide synthase [Clostridium grantii]SHH70294.1 cobyrinic acid a,c-diamide synthase [Clostridium grantii DSM 8605]
MKTMLISSNSSGGGKTTVTIGLMKALMNRGYKVQGYKAGPDYIDSAFHSHVLKNKSRNLDLFLMKEEGVKASFNRGEGDLAVIEGVMGLYDGKGITSEYSTAHLAKTLDVPVVLVLSPKAVSNTLCAEILGIMNYDNVKIVGVILTNIAPAYYKLLKIAIEKNCGLKVFGYIPKNEELVLGSRHLGLIQSSEIDNLDSKIELCARLIEENVNLDELIEIFEDKSFHSEDFKLENKDMKIGVAYDKAFSFYYKENLELLSEVGEIVYFSPLNDKGLPKDIDFLYIGGGYPEVFIKELSQNKSMLKSIKEALENGLNCYAECGGLMYLTEAIEGHETVGFFKGEAHMTKRLQNFGYSDIEVVNENKLLPTGLKISTHEFHKSYIDTKEKSIYKLEKINYEGILKTWECGYVKGNTLGAYGHVHFFNNISFIKSLIENIR